MIFLPYLQLRLELPPKYLVAEIYALCNLHEREKIYWERFTQVRQRAREVEEIGREFKEIQRAQASLTKKRQHLQNILYDVS